MVSIARDLSAGFLAAALFSALLASPTSAQDGDLRVGIAAAVNPATVSTPPGATSETLPLGKPIVFMEEIETNPAGQAQVLFLDRSSLTIGPDSFVIVDEFVFDPALADGSLTMTLERGLVRYIGGQISKDGGVTIETDLATIGIRGGMAIAEKRQPDLLRVINLFGRLTVTPRDGSAPFVVDDPSEFALVSPQGLQEIGLISAAQLTNLYQQFEGGTMEIITATIDQGLETTPGAEPSADQQAAGGGALGSGTPAGDPQQAAVQLSEQQAALDQVVALGRQQEQISNTEPETSPDTPVVSNLSGSYLATPDPYTTPSGASFANPLLQNALGGPSQDFNRRYQDGEILDDGLLQIDSNGDGSIDLILPISEGSFEVGLSESASPLGPLTGTGQLESLSGDRPFFTYDLRTADGSRRVQVVGGLPSDPSLFRQGGLEVFSYQLDAQSLALQALPGGGLAGTSSLQATDLLVATAPGGGFDPVEGPFNSSVLWMAFGVEGEGAEQTSILQASAGKLLDLGNGRPVLSQTVRGSIAQAGGQPAGLTRTEVGLGSAVDDAGNAFYGSEAERVVLTNNGPFPLDESDPNLEARNISQVLLQPYNDLGGTALGFSSVAPRVGTDEGLGQERPDTTLVGYASGVGVSRLPGGSFSEIYRLEGGPGYPDGGGGVTFQRDPNSSSLDIGMELLATPIITSGSAPSSAFWSFGGIGAENSAYLDQNHYAATEAFTDQGQGFDGQVNRNDQGADGQERFGFRSYVLGQDPVPASAAFPDTQFCECAYLQWGYWGGEYQYDPSGPQAGRRERVHIGAWVAGERPSAADIAGLSGTATHSGHVFGTVTLGNGSQYLAPGRYDQTFNFGTDSGTFTISQFDSRDFTGGTLGVKEGGHPADFSSVNPARSADGLNAKVRGSFFVGRGGDPAGQVGGTFTIDDGGKGDYAASGILAGDRR
ncbi:MAG: hypothetical protein AAFY02_02460 [Pseudomonadota bacterium]